MEWFGWGVFHTYIVMWDKSCDKVAFEGADSYPVTISQFGYRLGWHSISRLRQFRHD